MSETILDKVAAAHPGAMEGCLTRYGPLVWSLARRWSPTFADAEDAAQEIFSDLWRAAERFDPRREPSEATFVAMIARRRLIDRYRKRERQPNTTELEHSLTVPAAVQPDRLELAKRLVAFASCSNNCGRKSVRSWNSRFFKGCPSPKSASESNFLSAPSRRTRDGA